MSTEKKDVRQEAIAALRATRTRITNPEHWIEFNFAADIKGKHVPFWSSEATKWCAMGALLRETYGRAEVKEEAMSMIEESRSGQYDVPLSQINDVMGHDEVLRYLDHVIETNLPDMTPNYGDVTANRRKASEMFAVPQTTTVSQT